MFYIYDDIFLSIYNNIINNQVDLGNQLISIEKLVIRNRNLENI